MAQKEYVVSYYIGNTTLHIVAPQPLTEDEKIKIYNQYIEIARETYQSCSGKN